MAAAASLAPSGRHLRELDWLMLAVVALCCLGLVMSVSVSGPQDGLGPLGAMKSQGGKLLFGLIGFLACALMPLQSLRRLALPAFFTAALLCAATRVLGAPVNHAHRWLQFGSYSFQPVELARFLMLIAIADLLARAGAEVRSFRRGFLPVMGCGLLLAAALIMQPDHGNALVVMALCACVALCAGARSWHFVPLLAMGCLFMAMSASRHGYVQRRLTDFLDVRPATQVGQALVAIASGGVFGRGLGEGWMKMGFVPEAQNDFVFAVVAEELGYAGSLLVLLLYTVIGVTGYRLVCSVRDPFLRYLVCGFILMLCIQAAVNLMVVSGWAPAKGIDLPFVSSGGSSLLFCLAAVGIVGNAARSDRSVGFANDFETPGRV